MNQTMKKAAKKIAMTLGAGALGLSLCFNAAAQESADFLRDNAATIALQSVRPFDQLCKYDNGRVFRVFARFAPSYFDYHARLTPDGPITRGEHIRDILIETKERVAIHIAESEASGQNDVVFNAQLGELRKAMQAFDDVEARVIDPTDLPQCTGPLPQPHW